MTNGKQPQLSILDTMQLPNEIIVDLMKAVFLQGSKFKFQAKGASMEPFIRDGDILTVVSINEVAPKIGKVVAYIDPQSRKMILHRIVAEDGSSFLIKGDNSASREDGWVAKAQLLGVVSSVEREEHEVRLGLKFGGRLIAFLSKNKLLTRIINRIGRL